MPSAAAERGAVPHDMPVDEVVLLAGTDPDTGSPGVVGDWSRTAG